MLRTLPWVALALSCTPPSPPPEPVERPAAAAQALSYELGLELGRKMQARGTEPDLPSVTRGVKEGYQAASSVSQARAPAPMKEPEALRRLCTGCHALARPTDLTRAWWSEVLTRMNAWMTRQGLGATPAELEAITRWYEAGAPRAWQLPADPPPSQLRFEPTPLRGLTEVAAITLADLNGDGRPELLTGDLASGSIQRWDLRDGTWSATWLGLAGAPVRITAADVDGDGDQDLVVADIGAFRPAEQDTGRVLLLRAERGEYRAEVLWAGAPRPCDVRVADVDGDGDPDVIVAAFGWFTAGEIVWLEQHPSGWRRHRVIQRTGAVDVTPTDLDGDGGLDLVALFAQEHEEIVALRQHTGGFRPQRLHAAGTPLYGSSGLQVVDLDGDGQRDLLYVNGDSQDGPPGPRPDHGVRWLKRQGGAYEVRDIGRIGEAFRAAPGDLDGDGDLDVVLIRNRRELREPGAALLWFEQREEGWRGHSIGAPHAALRAVAVGDLDADGRVEIVTGGPSGAEVWRSAR